MFEIDIECPICFNQYSDLSFNIDNEEVVRYTLNPCNHVCCKECATKIKNCFYCRVKIDKKTKHISKSNKDGGLRRAVGLSTELKYFLINFCNCTLLDIEKIIIELIL